MIQPQIILLKEGTDTSQGKPHVISNINACVSIANILKTTLGPMGMDKLIKNAQGVTISNDGATLIKLLDVVHPAAKALTEVAQSQDKEIGDGTTSVVLLAAELLKNAKEFVEEGVNPQIIAKGYRLAADEAIKKLTQIAVDMEDIDLSQFGISADHQVEEKKQFLLEQCAKTALTSKLIEEDKSFFAKMIVDAFIEYEPLRNASADFFTIKSVSGGSIKDSFLVEGVAFKKTFSYAGFEQQPKKFKDPKIVLLNVTLELESEHISGEVRIDPSQFDSIANAEWSIFYAKLDAIYQSGANVILSKQPIGDLATQYFAEKGVFCAGRVPDADMRRLSDFTGGAIHSSLRYLSEKTFESRRVSAKDGALNNDSGAIVAEAEKVNGKLGANSGEFKSTLGECSEFEEKQVGKERFNFFSGSKRGKTTTTLVLRGGAEQYIEEASRSLNDAVMVVKNTIGFTTVVAGGGATEIEMSQHLKSFSRTLEGKNGLFALAFAKAFEVIPRCLSQNAGLDSTDVLNQLRAAHHRGEKWAGVDFGGKGFTDLFKHFVWEPAKSKRRIIEAATDAACQVLSVDETIRVPKSEASQPPGAAPGMNMMPGGGLPMMG